MTHHSMLVRHLLSIALLPFLVVVIVPWILRDGAEARLDDHSSFGVWVSAGLVLLAGVWPLRLVRESLRRLGRGTLASRRGTWCSRCPYRHVRSPMISGVALMLLGKASLWGRLQPSLLRALGGAGLERRFGEEDRVYKANIPRWYRGCSRGLVRSTAILEIRVLAQAG